MMMIQPTDAILFDEEDGASTRNRTQNNIGFFFDDEEEVDQEEQAYIPSNQFAFIQHVNDLSLEDVQRLIDNGGRSTCTTTLSTGTTTTGTSFGDDEYEDDLESGDLDRRSDIMVEIAIHLILRIIRLHTDNQQQEQEEQIENIIRFLATAFEPHPKITQHYVKLLEVMDELRPMVIEKIPEICGGTAREVELIITQLSQCMSEDRSLCTCSVGALYDLPNLSHEQKKRISSITMASLDYVEEDDIPVLVRTLLKTITKETAAEVVESIRSVCRTLSPHICSMLCSEVLVTTFSVNPIAVKSFISAIKQPGTIPLSRFDVLVILTLLHTHQRERKSIFNIMKCAYQAQPVSLLSLNTLMETLAEDYISLSQSRIYSNSIYSLIVYMLHNKSLYREGQTPWAHPLCLLVFRLYQDKQPQLVSSLLASFQPNECNSLNDIGYSISQCVSGDILMRMSSMTSTDDESERSACQMLAEYSNLLEDGLMRAKKISVRSIHALCYVLCRCCQYKPKIIPNLMMFLRKQLFSAQDVQTQIGLIASSHLLHMIGSSRTEFKQEYKEEFNTVLEWVLQTFQATELNLKSIYFLDLIQLNLHSIDVDFMEHIYDNCLNPLVVQHVELIAKHQSQSKNNRVHFAFNNSKYYFNISNLFRHQNDINMTSMHTLYQLIKCYVGIQCHMHKQENLLKLLQYGYEVDHSSLYSVLLAFVISISLCHSLTDYTDANSLNMDLELVHHIVYVVTCFRNRIQEMHDLSHTNEQKKSLIRQVLLHYQLDLNMIATCLSHIYSSNYRSDMISLEAGNKFHIDSRRMEIEMLELFWSSLKSFNITKQSSAVLNLSGSLSMSKQKDKGIATKNIAEVIVDCYSTQQPVNFGALFQRVVSEGPLEQLIQITQQCVHRMFLQSADLVDRLAKSRKGEAPPPVNKRNDSDEDEEEEEKEDEDVEMKDREQFSQSDEQYHMFISLCYIYSTLGYMIYQMKQHEDETILTTVIETWSVSIDKSCQLLPIAEKMQITFEYLLGQFFKCQEYHLSHLSALCLFGLTRNTNQQSATGFIYRYIMCNIYPSYRGISADAIAVALHLIADSLLLKQYPLQMIVRDKCGSSLLGVLPSLSAKLPQATLNNIQAFVTQLLLLAPMCTMKAEDCDLYLKDFTMAMNDLVLVLNGSMKPGTLVSEFRREHIKYRMLNDATFYKFLAVLVPVNLKGIENCSTTPDYQDKRHPFRHLQNAIRAMKQVTQITIQCIFCVIFKKGIHKITTLVMNSCMKVTELLKQKLDECFLHRIDPSVQNLEPYRYVSLFRSMKQWSTCCISLCKVLKLIQEKRKFTPSENKRRELVVRLFFCCTKFEEYLEGLKQNYQIYPKPISGDDEIDEYESGSMLDDSSSDDEEDDDSSDEIASRLQKWIIHDSERALINAALSKWTSKFEKQFKRDENIQSSNEIGDLISNLWSSSASGQTFISILFSNNSDREENDLDQMNLSQSVEEINTNSYPIHSHPDSGSEDDEDDDDRFCMRKVEYDETGQRKL